MHDALAFRFFAQRPLDCFDLAANAADAGEQLFLSKSYVPCVPEALICRNTPRRLWKDVVIGL